MGRLMNEFLIDYGRVGASTTNIFNPADRAYSYKGTKLVVKRVRSEQEPIINITLEKNLEIAFYNLKLAFPSLQITASFRSSIILAIITLVHAYDKVLSRSMVAQSFADCGLLQKPDPVTGLTLDMKKLMSNCYYKLNTNEILTMQNAVLPMVDLLKANGRNTWGDMDKYNIPVSTTSINRDNLTHIRHWSEIINHSQTVARYNEEILARTPEFIEAQRLRREAANKVQQIEAERAKATSKLEAKRLELQRVSNLSPEEKLVEKNSKSLAAATRKENKRRREEEKEIEYQNSKRVLNGSI